MAASKSKSVAKRGNGRSLNFMAYRRENGRVGVRNHVIILPVDDISNACVEKVANKVQGTLALPHAYGRLQFGEDLELHFRTMIGTGANPNVAAVRRHRHRAGLDAAHRRRHREDRQAGRGLLDRGPRRSSTTVAARVAQGQGIRAWAIGAPARGVRLQGAVHLRASAASPTRRRACLEPDRRQRARQDRSARRHGQLRRNVRADRRRAHLAKAAANKEVEAKFTAMFERLQRRVRPEDRTTCRNRSRPRATSPAA